MGLGEQRVSEITTTFHNHFYSQQLIRDLPLQVAGVLSFSYSLCLLTDLYWLIYDLMRPESRMPFAASVSGMVWDSSLCFR